MTSTEALPVHLHRFRQPELLLLVRLPGLLLRLIPLCLPLLEPPVQQALPELPRLELLRPLLGTASIPILPVSLP